MAKHPYTEFPAFYWGPDGESKMCNAAEDVPEGWTDQHPGHFDGMKPPPAPVPPAPAQLSRKEIIVALEEGGFEFARNLSTVALHALLREKVTAFLTECGATFDPKSETKVLLRLLPRPE